MKSCYTSSCKDQTKSVRKQKCERGSFKVPAVRSSKHFLFLLQGAAWKKREESGGRGEGVKQPLSGLGLGRRLHHRRRRSCCRLWSWRFFLEGKGFSVAMGESFLGQIPPPLPRPPPGWFPLKKVQSGSRRNDLRRTRRRLIQEQWTAC